METENYGFQNKSPFFQGPFSMRVCRGVTAEKIHFGGWIFLQGDLNCFLELFGTTSTIEIVPQIAIAIIGVLTFNKGGG